MSLSLADGIGTFKVPSNSNRILTVILQTFRQFLVCLVSGFGLFDIKPLKSSFALKIFGFFMTKLISIKSDQLQVHNSDTERLTRCFYIHLPAAAYYMGKMTNTRINDKIVCKNQQAKQK